MVPVLAVFKLLPPPVRFFFAALLTFAATFEKGQGLIFEVHRTGEHNAKGDSVDPHILNQLDYTAIGYTTLLNFFL